MRRLLRLLIVVAILAGAAAVAVLAVRRRGRSWPAPEPGWTPPAVEPVLTIDEDEALEQEIADAEAEGMRAPDWEPAVDVAIDETGHVVEPEPPAEPAIVEEPDAGSGPAAAPAAGAPEELSDEAVRQLFAEAAELERAVAEFEQLEQAFTGTFGGIAPPEAAEAREDPDFAAMLAGAEPGAEPLILPIEDEAEPAAEPLPAEEAPAQAEPDVILSRFEELAAMPEPEAPPAAAGELERQAADAANEGMAPPPGAPPVDEARDASGAEVTGRPTAAPGPPPAEAEEPLPASLEAALGELQPAPIQRPPRRTAESYVDEGNVYFNVGQFALAIDRYTAAIELDPDLTAAYYNRANAYTRSGEFEKALADYNRALELQPNDPDALNNRGMLHLYRGNYAAALADFDAALAVDPGDTTVMVNRGLAHLHGGDAAAALLDFLAAAGLDPDDPAAHYGAAQAAASMGNREEALRHVQRALALDRGYAREAAADPRLAILQGDPEFLRLLREAGQARQG
jgi:tetratricopeptide (TPR) repeat protein